MRAVWVVITLRYSGRVVIVEKSSSTKTEKYCCPCHMKHPEIAAVFCDDCARWSKKAYTPVITYDDRREKVSRLSIVSH